MKNSRFNRVFSAASLATMTLPLHPAQANMLMFRKFHCHHRMDPRSRLRPAGFTLTEVLIVIVIIAVLAGLMFPFFRSMREKSQATVCAQNLRQIGIGLHAHISEDNGRIPAGRAFVSGMLDEDDRNLGISWYDAASKYLGREDHSKTLPAAFGCPCGHGTAYLPQWPYTGDYAVNLFLGWEPHKVLLLSAVKNPASTPYVQDTVKQNNFGEAIYIAGSSKTAGQAFADRHGGKGNILWVDGHVSSWTYSEYMEFANDPKHGGIYNFLKGNW